MTSLHKVAGLPAGGYSAEQLEAIRIFGKNDLSFGCLFKYKKGWDDDILTFCSIYDDTGDTKTLSYLSQDKESTWEINEYSEDTEIEILGHIPHLEDVFRIAKEGQSMFDVGSNYISISMWSEDREEEIFKKIPCDPTLPLLEQSEETLTQLISLFK